jgi:hypothetical protein
MDAIATFLILGVLFAPQIVAGGGKRRVPPPTQPPSREELLIIEAALNDPDLIQSTDGGRFKLLQQTNPAEGSLWIPTDPAEIQILGDRFLIRRLGTDMMVRVPQEVVDSYHRQNTASMSLKGIKMPKQTERSSARGVRFSTAYVVSRPGISEDGSTALVTLYDDNFAGYFAYLEKQDGVWRLCGKGGWYDT